ncbi:MULTISPECIES: hypothetical protein [Psychroflexus]|uniref:Glycine zipper n=1 Tax=Psychroflexus salarius TaxID=1155689 RepID=A0A1M4UYM3_9FLAO|nr:MULTISPECIES: hypothetical protein [Psychroflexus]QSS98107.1 hypothetical protein IMZ30_05170 [Psychroflexus sp. ALD_RP9]SHE61851.1 hypothetical protein SAMN05444278_103163 [Psychroflexus salarius]
MKNLSKFILSLIAIFIFSSCSEDSDSVVEDITLKNQKVDYGEMHNTGLNAYYKQKADKINSNLNEFSHELVNINNSLYPKYFNNVSDIKISKLSLKLYGTNDKTKFNYRERSIYLIDELVAEKQISRELGNLIESFVISNPNKNQILNSISRFKKKGVMKYNDEKGLEIFTSVYLASDQFWTERENNSFVFKSDCDPKNQVRIADAAGGIFGGLLGTAIGGFGGIVGASVGSQGYSALVEELQENSDGSRSCI